MTKKIKIGSRGSPLALAQVDLVKKALIDFYGPAQLDFDVEIIQTSGDRFYNKNLSEIGGKSLFTKEIEEALLAGQIDLAVHSMKDLSTEAVPGLCLPALLEREDPRDAWISRDGKTLADLSPNARVGTSSLRRASQILDLRPDLKIVPLRGNVGTRLKKIASGEADATLLAYAGLKRLGQSSVAADVFDTGVFVPAVAQGALVVQCRESDTEMIQLLTPLNHKETAVCVAAERAFLEAAEGSCRTPIGAYAVLCAHNQMKINFMLEIDGKIQRTQEICPPEEGVRLAREVADRFQSNSVKDAEV